MDQSKTEITRATPRQSNIEAQSEIRELSLNELDHVAGGLSFLRYTMKEVFISG